MILSLIATHVQLACEKLEGENYEETTAFICKSDCRANNNHEIYTTPHQNYVGRLYFFTQGAAYTDYAWQ